MLIVTYTAITTEPVVLYPAAACAFPGRSLAACWDPGTADPGAASPCRPHPVPLVQPAGEEGEEECRPPHSVTSRDTLMRKYIS